MPYIGFNCPFQRPFSSGSETLENFRAHLKTYAPKIFKFYGFDEKSGYQALKIFDTETGFEKIVDLLA
jgi:predicted protein tyrosine phosphatase